MGVDNPPTPNRSSLVGDPLFNQYLDTTCQPSEAFSRAQTIAQAVLDTREEWCSTVQIVSEAAVISWGPDAYAAQPVFTMRLRKGGAVEYPTTLDRLISITIGELPSDGPVTPEDAERWEIAIRQSLQLVTVKEETDTLRDFQAMIIEGTSVTWDISHPATAMDEILEQTPLRDWRPAGSAKDLKHLRFALTPESFGRFIIDPTRDNGELMGLAWLLPIKDKLVLVYEARVMSGNLSNDFGTMLVTQFYSVANRTEPIFKLIDPQGVTHADLSQTLIEGELVKGTFVGHYQDRFEPKFRS